MNRSLNVGLAVTICVCATAAIAAAPDTSTQSPAQRPQLVVLDVELSGDLGGPEISAEHLARLNAASMRLRDGLSRTGLYEVVDSAPARKLIDELRSRHRYLHDCNGCDLDVGRQLGADEVLVAWVDRVSALILTLSYEIHHVRTGRITARKSFGFRGDNDAAWTRALDYMVRDLKESAATQGSNNDH